MDNIQEIIQSARDRVLIRRLESIGEAQVRKNLKDGIYMGKKRTTVKFWLEQKDRERQEKKEDQELKFKKKD